MGRPMANSEKGTLTRVKSKFKFEFLLAIKGTLHLMQASGSFPQTDGEDHPKIDFINCGPQWQGGVLKIVNECAMYFDTEIEFDVAPDLFQLGNCILDLKSNTFRRALPLICVFGKVASSFPRSGWSTRQSSKQIPNRSGSVRGEWYGVFSKDARVTVWAAARNVRVLTIQMTPMMNLANKTLIISSFSQRC